MRERLLSAEKVKAIDWRDGRLQLLDQRRLPLAEVWHGCDSAAAVAAAIEAGRVRGAAAIELAAACGLLLGVRARLAAGSDWRVALDEDVRLLAAACPQSLAAPFGALQRLCERLDRLKPGEAPVAVAEATLAAMLASDREVNLGMAQLGAEYIRRHQGNPQNLLTHCGGGALASAGFGTALGVIRAAHLEGLVERVYVDEARPGLQGARLAAWELDAEGVPVTLNADACAAHLLKTRGITWVIVGAERIAANGDVLGLLGTYQLAVLAMHHGARFMVVAPTASIDMALESGEEMVIDEQAGSDLLALDGQRFAADVEAFNPLFDVTPADLVDVIVSEKGIVERPGAAKVAALMCRKRLH